MDQQQVELEICANCKREIPHFNYVMHTAHCARRITLCQTCKEPIPKAEFEEHKKRCVKVSKPAPPPPPTRFEQSQYYAQQKAVQDKKTQDRQERRLARLEKLCDSGHTLGCAPPQVNGAVKKTPMEPPKTSSLMPCQYCELELPKFDLYEHENYCGARTEKCKECGEHVMFKYLQLHLDSDHAFIKDGEPTPSRRRASPFRPFTVESIGAEYTASPGVTYLPGGGGPTFSTQGANGEKLETSKEISRRLDCKTEYIRNLLHDSASITAPLRSTTGAVPRHLRGQSTPRRRNPPTELLIPCEFCGTQIPHEDLIEHETGCRPDLARFNPRRGRADSPDYFEAPVPNSPEVELPCEFCSDLIPASRLLSHQATCN